MKASFYWFFLLITCIYFSSPLMAQDKDTTILKKDTLKKAVAADSADSTAPTPSHLELNVVYESNDVNNGREDSTVIPLITPKISYIFKSGFEIDLSVGYNINEPSPQVNQYTLDGSYSFNPGNYSGAVTLSGFIYSKQSGSTTSEQKGSLEYDNSYDFNFIEPSLNLTWTWSTASPDYQVSFALQHEYDIGNLSITPTATMNAATQNAYNAYYENRRYSIPRPDSPPLPANISLSGEVLNSGEFQILDYELSSPVNFTAGKWTFDFTPTYAMPVNPSDVKITTTFDDHTVRNNTYKQKLPNTSYVQVGITYDF